MIESIFSPKDRIIKGATNLYLQGSSSNGNEEVSPIHQSTKTGASF